MNLLNIVLNINILPVGGATNAPSFLDEIGPYVKAKKVIMIFDRDDAGYKGLKEYVNVYLLDGWQCQGGIGVLTQGLSYKVFYQAVVKGK